MNNDHTFKPGLYRHHRGGLYTALALVTHHHMRLKMVVYMSSATGEFNTRPLTGWVNDPDAWNDRVEIKSPDGILTASVKRFTLIEP